MSKKRMPRVLKGADFAAVNRHGQRYVVQVKNYRHRKVSFWSDDNIEGIEVTLLNGLNGYVLSSTKPQQRAAERQSAYRGHPKAMFLLALIAPLATREALLGDLLECRANNFERFGYQRAQIIFWRDYIGTAFNLLGAKFLRLAGVSVLIEKLTKFL